MVDYGLKIRNFSSISDNKLDSGVLALTNDYPFCGETILRELLKGRGIIIQGYRFRSKGKLKRRVYNVKGTNHLWYIGTNQKNLSNGN